MPDLLAREPIAAAPVSIVLLAHQEGPSFDESATGWLNATKGLQREYEVVVVDDGSSDDTRAQAEALAQRHSEIRVIHHPQRRGLGAALRTGLAVTRHPLVLTSPCDGQFDPGDLPKLLERIDKVDLVTGIRVWRPLPLWLRGLGIMYRVIARIVFGVPIERRSTWLGWSGYGRRWSARWIFGLRVQDGECLLRLYRRSILPRLVIQSDGPFALVEILAKANFLGCLMDEVPVAHHPRTKGGIADPDGQPPIATEAWRMFHAPDFGRAKLPT